MKVSIKAIFLLFALFLFATAATFAQEIDREKIERQFYNAYIKNSMPAWKITLSQLEKSKDKSSQLLLAKGYYGAATTGMGNKDKDFASEMLEKSTKVANTILKKDKKSAEANALLAVIWGMEIGITPTKGMALGSKSFRVAAKGIKYAPDNPFTNYAQGNKLYYTPELWGGDLKESLVFLEKSKSAYEKANKTDNWEYLALLALLGQSYHKQELFSEAKGIYETALKVSPDFNYVKMRLLPALEKDMTE